MMTMTAAPRQVPSSTDERDLNEAEKLCGHAASALVTRPRAGLRCRYGRRAGVGRDPAPPAGRPALGDRTRPRYLPKGTRPLDQGHAHRARHVRPGAVGEGEREARTEAPSPLLPA